MRRLILAVACLCLALVGSAAAALQQRAPAPLEGTVTLQCNPPLVTPTDSLVPQQHVVVHSESSSVLGGVLIWTNNANYYSFVGPKTFWWGRGVCRQASLPESLPRASLVRVAEPDMTCVVPGRRLLIHAARQASANSMSIRVMPHGQLLFRLELVDETVRTYASRYAVRLCELDS